MGNSAAARRFTDLDLEVERFRTLGYRVIDMIADYYASVRERPVFVGRTSQEVAATFEEPLPIDGQSPEAIVEEWRSKVLPNATHIGSPRYFGFVNGSGTMMGPLAEALAAAINMNVGVWKASPAATEVERRTIAWLAELIGYERDCGGLFLSGGTMANFTGLLAALRNTAPYDTTVEGLQRAGGAPRFTVYVGDHEGHVSITRAADLMNLGRAAVRPVPSRADFTMDPEALMRMLDEDAAAGSTPFCVVAQVGSINVGAIDPLERLAAICGARGLWLHVDGACGAVGAMLPEKRALYRGLELADSVTLDPHKWLYIAYECGCLLVRDREKLRRAFSITAPYLRGILSTAYTGLDFFEYGPQMSRGFRALKVWMSLKLHGVEGYRRLLAQNIRCVEHLHRLVGAAPDFEVLHEPVLFIYCFRFAPARHRARMADSPGAAAAIAAYLDDLNQRIADEMQLSGAAFFMTTKLRGRTVLRFSVCSHRTTLEDIDLVFGKIGEIGAALDRGAAPA